ncbi:MAG: hypothetical protein ABL901_10930 [Hyphomicrobiaceae bacterium]
MLGNIALYFANRAASGAVGTVTRWASWGAGAAIFAALALVFAVCAIFWGLQPRFSAVQAASLVAVGCLVLALVLIAIPAIQDAMEREAERAEREKAGALATTVTAVNKETEAAVDYFGPLQVVASAFLVGMRTGRQLRPARTK